MKIHFLWSINYAFIKIIKSKVKIIFFKNFIVYILIHKNNDRMMYGIKIALCTMGREENLYAKEFVDYYYKLGVDHLL